VIIVKIVATLERFIMDQMIYKTWVSTCNGTICIILFEIMSRTSMWSLIQSCFVYILLSNNIMRVKRDTMEKPTTTYITKRRHESPPK
jgi:hypothetical protein